MRRTAAAALLVASLAGAAFAQGAAVESRLLVGHWAGRWKSLSGSSDNVYLDVASVDGNLVRGTVFIAVATPSVGYYNRDLPFTGLYDGSELRIWIPPSLALTLKLSGDRLAGSVQGQQTYGAVELDRAR